jgi:PAS domain S-box-containing protein
MIGKTDFDLMPTENAVACKESDKLALQSQDIIRREEYTMNRWLDVVKRAVRDEDGNVTGIVCVIRDITERKAAEDKLKKSEATLEEAQRMGRIGSWVLDLVNHRLEWSDQIYRIFEVEPGAFKASYEAFLDAVHPDDRDFVKEAYTSSIKSRKPYDIVHRLLLKDGRLKYVNEKGETFYDDNGKPLRSIGTMQDITERKMMEENLARKAAAVEQAAESIVITDIEGDIVDVNPQFEKNTGYTKEEVIGRNPRILKSGKHDERFYKNLWNTITAGKVWRGTFVNKRKDGTLYDEEAVISPAFNEAGEIINYISVKRDVTERKLAEEKLKQSMNKLEWFNRLAVGREIKMIELKKEINALSEELGRGKKYEIQSLPGSGEAERE